MRLWAATKMITIHVRLLHEETEVFRPTFAEPLEGKVFKVLAIPNYDPQNEKWEFASNSLGGVLTLSIFPPIYHDLAQLLIARARRLYTSESFGVELKQTVYALDSTTIDLCLSLFPWRAFVHQGGGQASHVVGFARPDSNHDLDFRGKNGPMSACWMKSFSRAGAFYVMDRGYVDFARLYRFVLAGRILCHARQERLATQPPGVAARG